MIFTFRIEKVRKKSQTALVLWDEWFDGHLSIKVRKNVNDKLVIGFVFSSRESFWWYRSPDLLVVNCYFGWPLQSKRFWLVFVAPFWQYLNTYNVNAIHTQVSCFAGQFGGVLAGMLSNSFVIFYNWHGNSRYCYAGNGDEIFNVHGFSGFDFVDECTRLE